MSTYLLALIYKDYGLTGSINPTRLLRIRVVDYLSTRRTKWLEDLAQWCHVFHHIVVRGSVEGFNLS